MQKLFDISVIKTLKDGITKGRWSLEDLDEPPPGWKEVVTDCKGNPLFPQGYKGVEYKNLARVEEPKASEEKVELTSPKDLPPDF